MSQTITGEVIRRMSAEAKRQGGNSMLTHTPEGGTLIYIGPDEDSITEMLVDAAANIEATRS